MKTKKKVKRAKAKPAPPKVKRLPKGERGLHSVANVVPDVIKTLEEMGQAAKIRRMELERWAKEQPQSVRCPFGELHPVNMNESSRASHGQPNFVLVYDPCPKCIKAGDATNRESWLHRAGVPKILLHATLENWKPEKASDHAVLNMVTKFCAEAHGFLVLHGGVGLGKTHLAVAVMRELRRGFLISQNAFLLALRKTYRDDYAVDIVEKCKYAKLLVMDEMGVSTGGRDEFPSLYEVINHRYGEDLPTVITTNVKLDEFQSAFGDRIADRLVECAVFCELKGESKRGARQQ